MQGQQQRKRKASFQLQPFPKRQMIAAPPQQQLAVARKLRALSAPERKFNDVTLSADANTTPVKVALSTFATGDTALLRDGNKVLFKTIHIKCRLTNNAVGQSNTVRFVLVCDMLAQAEQCDWGDGTAVEDVFDAETVVARRNILSAERFKVLMDEVVVINQNSGTVITSQAYFERYIKIPLNFQLVAWSGASATIPVRNAYTLMYVGTTVAGTDDVGVQGTVRVRFEDK